MAYGDVDRKKAAKAALLEEKSKRAAAKGRSGRARRLKKRAKRKAAKAGVEEGSKPTITIAVMSAKKKKKDY